MSAPVYHGTSLKLTARNRLSEMSRPPTAATRVHSPSAMPIPTATSPSAITHARSAAWGNKCSRTDRIGVPEMM